MQCSAGHFNAVQCSGGKLGADALDTASLRQGQRGISSALGCMEGVRCTMWGVVSSVQCSVQCAAMKSSAQSVGSIQYLVYI